MSNPIDISLSRACRFGLCFVVGLLFFTAVGSGTAEASHNRAAQISWTKGAGSGQVEFSIVFVARASYYGYNEDDVGRVFTDPTLDFGDGSGTTPDLQILSLEGESDTLYAKNAEPIVHTYSGNGPYSATLSSCCRLSSPAHINNPDGNYAVGTVVNPGLQGSPTINAAPVVTCPIEGDCYFRINAADPAGRHLRFRLANSSEGGGGFVQPGPPFATNAASIDPDSGLFSWNARGAQLRSDDGDTYYSSQVVVEALSGSGDVESSVAVDFFIRLSDDAAFICQDTDGNSNPDNDGDALCDNWEDSGIPVPRTGQTIPLYDVNGDGTISASENADPNVPDVYVEVDWMPGFKPTAGSLSNVEKAFLTPEAGSGRQPVRLHAALAPNSIPHSSFIAFQGCLAPVTCSAYTGLEDFDHLKEHYFADDQAGEDRKEAKAQAFHYAIFGDRQVNRDGSSGGSGIAELIGNDFIVTMGGSGVPRSADADAGTFMHELGHNLGLQHGGGDSINCKPNYISVMNYSRQFNGFLAGLNRRLEYSSAKLTTLDESSLSEVDGILGGPANTNIAYATPKGEVKLASARGPIDWNGERSSLWPFASQINNGRVKGNVNRFLTNWPSRGCIGEEENGQLVPGEDQTLVGYDDWDNLKYDFRATVDFADGVHTSSDVLEEIPTSELAAVAAVDTDGDGVSDFEDNCSAYFNPDQIDTDGDGLGDGCGQETTIPENTSQDTVPVIKGNPKVGETLQVDAVEAPEPGSNVKYEWLRDGVPIAGAATTSYTLQSTDGGTWISARVSASLSDGDHSAVSSGLAVAGVNLTRPRIVGKPVVGKKLKVSLGTWSAPGYSYSYKWYVNGKPTALTLPSLKLKPKFKGKKLKVLVTANRAGFESAEATSNTVKVRKKPKKPKSGKKGKKKNRK